MNIEKDNGTLKNVLLLALQKAGAYIRRSIHKIHTYDYKSDINLVTEIDKHAEEVIVQILKTNFPGHAILAEESGLQGSAEYKWIIDPLDGTTNFVHTYPICCVSIACEKNDHVIMGGVHDPFRREIFFAEKGQGAYLNTNKIQVSKATKIKDALLATGFPYDRQENASNYLKYVEEFMKKTHGIRRTGSAALDLCYVACGRFDGFWETKLFPWDTAAGGLIVQEAGGRLSNFKGRPFSNYKPEILASNGHIHREMVQILKS